MEKIMFLPVDYEAPKTSNHYMKFVEGENKFRILSAPLLGWEDWLDKKPVRYKMADKPAKSIDPKKPVRHFWAMIVWNYTSEEIQILHLTQATLRKSLEALCKDADWGAPYFYDLKVMKTGEGIDTEYSLNPLPHKELSPHIKEMFNERRCNLDALFYNDDPFSKEHGEYTPGIFVKRDLEAVKSANCITMEQAYELDMILSECDADYRKWVKNHIQKIYNTENLTDLPVDIYEGLKSVATKKMEAHHKKQSESMKVEPAVDFILEA